MKTPQHKYLNEAPTPAPQRRILLVDDDVDVCEVLKSTLEWHRFDVTVVHRGVEGVLQVMDHDFDAILCDMMMPEMPGDMFYVAVQQLKPHLCKRFIFITAYLGNPRMDSFFRIASGQVLYKPLATDKLVATINRLIAATTTTPEKIAAAVEPELIGQTRASNRHQQSADRKSDMWVGPDGKLRRGPVNAQPANDLLDISVA